MKSTDNVLTLAKQCVAIPSYVDGETDEQALLTFLENFIRVRLPKLSVERQQFTDSGRANLLIRGKGQLRLLVVGHIDTVQPSNGWQTDPLQPMVRQGNLYGLGAADMKGSIAAFLTAMCSQNTTLDGLILLLYGDEEYDFKGIRRFLASPTLPKPDLILSLDGSLAVASGCRGLVELQTIVKGKAAHASNPANGVNAIMGSVLAIRQLETELAQLKDPVLGPTTLNVAYLRGGILQQDGDDEVWRRAGNVIADTVDMTLEVRSAVSSVTADFIRQRLAELLYSQGLAIESTQAVHDIVPWVPDFDKPELSRLQACYDTSNVPFTVSDRTFSGYLDVQMLTDALNVPAYVIGAGGGNKHGASEYVPLNNLRQATALYGAILKGFLGNE